MRSKKKLEASRLAFQSRTLGYLQRKYSDKLFAAADCSPPISYEYLLKTPLGDLQFTIYDTWIATRWANASLANIYTDCSNSGKWNFVYYSHEEIPEEAGVEFLMKIEKIMKLEGELTQ